MIGPFQRRLVEEALTWSGRIGCCSDKERYALRVWNLFDTLGVRNVPDKVEQALRRLMAWEECAGPCEEVNGFLRALRDDD